MNRLVKRKNIYDLYWYFAYERQEIFNKKNNQSPPWTNDVILQNYKFCNSYRVNDRISQYLIKNVIYTKNYSKEDTIFRIVLFKLFNKEETWEFLNERFGDIKLSNFHPNSYMEALTLYSDAGNTLYNDAYISCANKAFGYDRKHENHIVLINKMFVIDKLQDKIINSNTMEDAFNYIKSYPLIGNFMAYQLITDINYSEATNFSECEFTVAGPGSERGIKKCFISTGELSNEDIIKYMYLNQDKEFKRLGLSFKGISNRKLQYIDCQNIFCELDKYCREKVPDLTSNRVKIKKKYSSKKDTINYMYPPKWNVK